MSAFSHTEDRLLSPKEVAEVLGVSRDYVYRLIGNGTLPSRRIGRSQRRTWMSEVRAWADSGIAA